jgi:hypothetical protein
VRVVGQLAEKPPKPGQALRGVLVRQGKQDSIMLPEELPSFTTLHTGKVGGGAGLHLRTVPLLLLVLLLLLLLLLRLLSLLLRLLRFTAHTARQLPVAA